jgi:hypothetical protein
MGAVGIFTVWVLMAMLPPAVGIVAWVMALALPPVAPPPRLVRRRWLAPGTLVMAAAALAGAVDLAGAGRTLVALPVAGVGLTAAAAAFYLVRARGGGHDDDSGGGPPRGGNDDTPRTPGGDGADWIAFERDFWAHVERERRSTTRDHSR